ncbi:Smg [Acrasis kona]|uniref:Smg n=1 Tax=Acrasis kona TaxID=1008807 RepID=A0AAW2ZE21_9EUKA
MNTYKPRIIVSANCPTGNSNEAAMRVIISQAHNTIITLDYRKVKIPSKRPLRGCIQYNEALEDYKFRRLLVTFEDEIEAIEYCSIRKPNVKRISISQTISKESNH